METRPCRTGISTVLVIKAAVLLAAGEGALGLTRPESARVAVLLAGGGEFAFVVFKLGEDLGVLPDTLAKLLTACVIISMALTPLLGEAAGYVGERLLASDRTAQLNAEAEYPHRGAPTHGPPPARHRIVCTASFVLSSTLCLRRGGGVVGSRLFDAIDADASGEIEPAELQAFLQVALIKCPLQ